MKTRTGAITDSFGEVRDSSRRNRVFASISRIRQAFELTPSTDADCNYNY